MMKINEDEDEDQDDKRDDEHDMYGVDDEGCCISWW